MLFYKVKGCCVYFGIKGRVFNVAEYVLFKRHQLVKYKNKVCDGLKWF